MTTQTSETTSVGCGPIGCFIVLFFVMFITVLGFIGWNFVRAMSLQNQILNGCIVVEQTGNQTRIVNTGACK